VREWRADIAGIGFTIRVQSGGHEADFCAAESG
jgi:hypothetical protein